MCQSRNFDHHAPHAPNMPPCQPPQKIKKRKEPEPLPDQPMEISSSDQVHGKPITKRIRAKSDTIPNNGGVNNERQPLINIPLRPEPIAGDKLRNFVLFKAFDIIGDGGYRRFVLKNKNNGEQWAVAIYNDAQYTTRFLRATLQLMGQLAGSVPCVKLHKLCQRVTNDMNPPSISTQGWCICALTGMRTENTTQLGRSNKGEVCYVHRKFHVFFTMLWFIARFELCIKYATMQWLQQHNTTPNHNIQTLCEKLQKDEAFTKNICQCIQHATQHVTDSVIMHIKRVGRGSMLNVDPLVQTRL
jgi:hypothetical protein